ncbi:hypothetical protein P43SY_006552 [Pythium insidiosum]|uniref:Anoctamin transmembrane domain-containing protein n=1 Tax=Pythium insidiosum TaxID=114742 RepID=A0AAD5LDU9_PYTIN|nr:hypothetical protein P43SY_006552 [Pythium insidiosum]
MTTAHETPPTGAQQARSPPASTLRRRTAAASTLRQVLAPSGAAPNAAAFSDAPPEEDEAAMPMPWADADYCLYLEVVPPPPSQASADADEQLAWDSAHGIVEATATLLRDAGCDVELYPLQSWDSEVSARSLTETKAYVLTVDCAAMAAGGDDATAAPLPRLLPPWLAALPAFKLVAPLRGAARSQQLTRLLLREFRLPNDVYLRGDTLVLRAQRRLLRELGRHDHLLRAQLFPLHRERAREKLLALWSQQRALHVPLTAVSQYFGPKLAMYFAWLECYTDALFAPAVGGAIVYLLFAHWHLRVRIAVLAIAVALGTSLFADTWKRRQREVEYMWQYQHVMETDAVVDLETRPQFRGEWVQDAVTKRRLFDFPHGKRLRRQLLAIPLLLVMCALVGAYVVALHLLSDWLRAAFPMCFLRAKPAAAELAERGLTSTTCLALSQGPGVLNAVIIQLMDNWYQRLARRLNEYENYRTQAEFDEHLVMKRMPFHFVNSNASLWFLAFYVRSLDRVRDRLWILMVMTQLVDNFKEVGLPFIASLSAKLFTADGHRRHPRREHPSLFPSPRRLYVGSSMHFFLDWLGLGLGATAADSAKPLWRHRSARPRTLEERLQRVLTQKRQAHYVDTFADFKEMLIQFGYVAQYTPIFPLAPCFAWLNNVVEVRSDLFKLINSNGFQRPLVQHTQGIGAWSRVLGAISVAAVVVNCGFVWTFEMRKLLPAWSELHRFMLLVACEHAVLALKAFLRWAAPDTPTWIQNEKRLAALSSTHAVSSLSPPASPRAIK